MFFVPFLAFKRLLLQQTRTLKIGVLEAYGREKKESVFYSISEYNKSNFNEVFVCVCLLVFLKTDGSLNPSELGPPMVNV